MMNRFLRLADEIDAFSERTGRVVCWLTLAMVVIGGLNAIVRYVDRFTGFGLSSNTYIEAQWYLFAGVFLLAAAYTLKHDAHVRVDVLYGRLNRRGRAWIDLAGTVLFLMPFCVLMIATSWPFVADSWMRTEMSPDPGGLPRYPIKTLVPLAFVLIFVQGVSLLIRQIAVLRGHRAAPQTDRGKMGEGI